MGVSWKWLSSNLSNSWRRHERVLTESQQRESGKPVPFNLDSKLKGKSSTAPINVASAHTAGNELYNKSMPMLTSCKPWAVKTVVACVTSADLSRTFRVFICCPNLDDHIATMHADMLDPDTEFIIR